MPNLFYRHYPVWQHDGVHLLASTTSSLTWWASPTSISLYLSLLFLVIRIIPKEVGLAMCRTCKGRCSSTVPRLLDGQRICVHQAFSFQDPGSRRVLALYTNGIILGHG